MRVAPEAVVEMFRSVSLGGPENSAGFVMWRLAHRFKREVDRALRPSDLTHLQFTVLALIAWMSRTDGEVAQAALARFGDIHPMQVSLVLQALDRKAMVVREAGRGVSKTVALTSSGLDTLREAMPRVRAVHDAMFGEEGTPGGVLLDALLRVDGRQG